MQPLAKHIRQLANAIETSNAKAAEKLLGEHPSLPNADLRNVQDQDQFSNGFPLYRACEKDDLAMAHLLLEYGADPDAPSSNTIDRPEHGMPLHLAVRQRNYQLANLLLDHGASPNGFPYCDQSTIEIVFYLAREAEIDESLIRQAYKSFLPDREKLESRRLGESISIVASNEIKLFARMIDLGGQPPLIALVRERFDDLVQEIVATSPDVEGSRHDYPRSTIFRNALGATRWFGYPILHRRLMETYPDRFDYQTAIETIDVAISSHNRDGSYADYREIILMHLELLKQSGELEIARQDSEFQPLLKMATDFTWHRNYGYRAEIAKPECYIDLAELFVEWGFDKINYRNPMSKLTALSAARQRASHPGIGVYIQWLLNNGAKE